MAEQRALVLLNGQIQELPTGDTLAGILSGATILSGTVDPTTEGNDGDLYYRTDTNTIFGPKVSGVWPAGVSLVGPSGSYNVQNNFPSYGNLHGFGDRDSLITVTTGLSITGPIANLVDGSFVQSTVAGLGSCYFVNGQAVAGQNITFEFPHAKRLNQMKWHQSGTQSHGTWKVQGSVDGVAAYVDLSSNFTLGDSQLVTINLDLWDGVTGYTHFRLEGVSGNTSGSPWLYEVEFSLIAASEPLSYLLPTGGTAGQVISKVDGTDYNVEWTDIPATSMVQTEITATAYSTVNGDFAGNVIRRMNNASTQTVTVEPSMTGGQPVTFIRTGAGAVTFSAGAGVTIYSAGGNLSIADQYGSATLIPDATTANTYYLIGKLTA